MCATTVEETFDNAITGQTFLLTNDGELRPGGQSVIFPEEMFEVWTAEQVASLLDSAGRPALSRHVSGADSEKLVQWGVVERVGKEHVLAALQSKHLPRPETWRRLLKLWAYVAPDVTGWRMTANRSKLRILPAQGKNVLYSAGEVVRLGEKRLLQSEEDWDFLSAHLLVLNQNWTRFITEQRRSTEGAEDAELDQEAGAAQAVLTALGLEESSDLSKVVDEVAAGFFRKEFEHPRQLRPACANCRKAGRISGRVLQICVERSSVEIACPRCSFRPRRNPGTSFAEGLVRRASSSSRLFEGFHLMHRRGMAAMDLVGALWPAGMRPTQTKTHRRVWPAENRSRTSSARIIVRPDFSLQDVEFHH